MKATSHEVSGDIEIRPDGRAQLNPAQMQELIQRRLQPIPMKIELKNLQHVERLSEETHCFTATLYLNGVKRGEVSNRGTGGGDDFTDHTARREIDDYAITLPAKEYQGIMLRMNAEILIGELVEAHLQTQYEKKLCRNKTAFTIPGDEPGSFRTISRPYTPESKAWILSNHPTAVILNEKYV